MKTSTRAGGPTAARPSRAPDPLGRQESIEALLAETGRGIVPIRRGFLQRGHGRTTKPGPLSEFTHDERGLETYLFAHAMAAAPPWDVTLPAGAWVRALGLADGATEESARAAVSKVLKRLEDRKLIVRRRRNRKSVVTLLREDGTEQPYERPFGHTRDDKWLQLPLTYWLDGHYLDLSLAAKIALLIALSRPDGFPLPEHMAPDWYGVSPDLIGDGLRELLQKELLEREFEWIRAPRSETGWTQTVKYTLIGSFSAEARKEASRSRYATTPDEVPTLADLQDLADVEEAS
jgi:hypothetical protein